MNPKTIAKELKDFELEIKQEYPEAEFVNGAILNAKVSEEKQEYYFKLYTEYLKNKNM